MNVNPLDLQVLFSKALDVQKTVQGNALLNQNVEDEIISQNAQNSRDAPEVVRKTEEYAEEFTRTNENGKNTGGELTEHRENEKREENPKDEENHGGLIDELAGHHVDITD